MENTDIFKKLDYKKIQINWNKNPIEMEVFRSFLPSIEFTISRDHLGSSNGWTKIYNEKHKLTVCGGIVNGKNYLDSIQYGVKLQNPYNNYVNPFYLFDIMNQEGRNFFISYYRDDINKMLKDSIDSLEYAKRKIKSLQEEIEQIKTLLS